MSVHNIRTLHISAVSFSYQNVGESGSDMFFCYDMEQLPVNEYI